MAGHDVRETGAGNGPSPSSDSDMSAACRFCEDPALVALACAVADDDIDRAMTMGLLEFASPRITCAACATRIAAIESVRDARRHALAARERYRARQARLAERARTRAQRRHETETRMPAAPTARTPSPLPALPPAAALALARAKAKAAAKRGE